MPVVRPTRNALGALSTSVRLTVLGAVVAAAALLPAASASAAEPGIGGYTDPSYASACTFHRYGEGETPPLSLFGADPLCVEYAKRDITVSNGGAARFLLAEPARFALAVPACRYWQLDHWSVQATVGGTELVGWDGSYWFDKAEGSAAARVRNITVAGQPARAEDAAKVIRPYDARLADALVRDAAGVMVRLPVSGLC
ncbi:hypothetical protein RPQ02_33520 [Streptomyces sp. AM2-3-1]|uniref:hypothetical protein n=1 Tax=Streptomyces TaxID=1883 RepID=UPI0028C46692|nr:hypothetical protein [Streptomyces sp. AM2-3-1]WNO68390.1 hypothetical protein RPQ02_33520 [Streptomyces sp. AM2-3-1]